MTVNAGYEAAEQAQSVLLRALAGYCLAALFLPSLALVADASGGSPWAAPIAVMIAVGVALLVASRISQSALAWLGGLVVFAAAWLIPQTSQAWVTCFLGLIIGLGFGMVAPPPYLLRSRWAPKFLALGCLQLVLLAVLAGDDSAIIGGGLFGLAMLGLSVASRGLPRRRAGAAVRLAVTGTVLLTALTTSWVGANSRTAAWFGSLVNHGPRHEREVALTFDDGPNVGSTLKLRGILDRAHVKGTFFTVGKALDADSEISRALMSDGHLLGNHSYLHDSLRWLDPGYPELERTQQAFKRDLGVCPTFFRPPHGQHTPFMADVVADHGMTMVGWDVSSGDWATHDPKLIAKRTLDRVRPGSIILLHDGLDGNPAADRSVVVRALPLILEGLMARHLRAVRLDELLGKPGYGKHC